MIVPKVESEVLPPLGVSDAPVRHLAFFDSSTDRAIATLQENGDKMVVTLQTYTVKSSLFGAPEIRYRTRRSTSATR